MQHLWFSGENQTPAHETTSFAKKLVKFFMVMMVLGLFALPKEASAQPFLSNLETLRDAINGNAAAITQITNDLTGVTPPISTAEFLQHVRDSVGGGSTITTVNLLNQVIGGNTAALASLQAALGGNAYFFYEDDGGFGPGYNLLNCFDGTFAPSFYFPICQANDLINWIIAGEAEIGIQTMIDFLEGEAGATSVVNWVMNGPAGATYLRDTLVAAMGAGNLATAIANLQAVKAGDPYYHDIFMQDVIDPFNMVGAVYPIDQMSLDWVNSTGPNITPGPAPPGPPPGPIGNIPVPIPPAPPGGPPTYTEEEIRQILQDLVDAGLLDPSQVEDLVDAYLNPPTPPTPGPGPGPGPGPTPGPLFEIDDPAPGPTSNCSASDAPLTGSFATDPCVWARDSSYTSNWSDNYFGDTFTNHQGGWQIVEYVARWWNEKGRFALQDMTTQLHASIIDQTRQMQSMADTHDLSKSARMLQNKELEAKARVAPNEMTCSASSSPPALAHGGSTANALSKALTNDLIKETNATTSVSAPRTLAEDVNRRLETYCNFFLDPDDNASRNSCPDPETAGPLPDGDVNVENVLFKDTIDFSDEPQRLAATALLRNLIYPNVQEVPPEGFEEKPEGRQWILQQEHFKAIRTIASDVVTSIMSRRMALPETAAAGVMMPPPAPPYAGDTGDGDYDTFAERLGGRESGGNCGIMGGSGNKYAGKYQMGCSALKTAGCISNANCDSPVGSGVWIQPSTYNWTGTCGGYPVNSLSDFLNNCAAQRNAVEVYHGQMWNYVTSGSAGACALSRVGTTVNGVLITPSGLLAGAHLVGQGGVWCALGCSSCSSAAQDANGTKAEEYMQKFGGYEIPWDATSGGYPNQAGAPFQSDPRPLNEIIREIREKAGVAEERISDAPSYNEIMLAMTQERYFDPQYFIKMANNIGALQQEQNMVSAYTALLLQDIYKLQEQINALLAARAAMKLNQAEMTPQEGAQPLR